MLNLYLCGQCFPWQKFFFFLKLSHCNVIYVSFNLWSWILYHILQAAVIKQDSILELLLQPQATVKAASGGVCRPLWRDGGNREASAGSTIGELALLQRQHSLLQEELLRLRDAESRFKDSERARAKLERQVRHMKVCSEAPSASKQLGERAFVVRTSIFPNHILNKIGKIFWSNF